MAATAQVSAQARRRRSKLARRERNWGLIFLAPWIAGFLLFFFLPMLASLIFSFTNFDLVNPEGIAFVGLDNWKRLFTDANVRLSLAVTLRFMLIAVPAALVIPLLFALLLNSRPLLGKRLFRTLFFLPQIIPLVAGTLIWQGTLNTQSGWVNRILEAVFGISPGPNWLQSASLVIPTLTLVILWSVGNTMIVFLTGLQNVPTELYEAARVDGAGAVRGFFSITIPLISPVIFYNLVLATIGGFQQWALIKKGRERSTFVDPATPAQPIEWVGRWRTLDRVWSFSPNWGNFREAWNTSDPTFGRLFLNSIAIASIGTIGTVLSASASPARISCS
jgi:multiple sugar transport system permease protein